MMDNIIWEFIFPFIQLTVPPGSRILDRPVQLLNIYRCDGHQGAYSIDIVLWVNTPGTFGIYKYTDYGIYALTPLRQFQYRATRLIIKPHKVLLARDWVLQFPASCQISERCFSISKNAFQDIAQSCDKTSNWILEEIHPLCNEMLRDI